MKDIYAKSGKPFKSKAGAVNSIRFRKLGGYVPVEVEGGWIGCEKITDQELADMAIEVSRDIDWLKNNQILMDAMLSDAEKADQEPDEPKEEIPNYSGLKVFCPMCGENYHMTTDKFDPDKDANSSMYELLPNYAEWGWPPPPLDPSGGYGNLECPDCEALLAPEGRLKVRV